MEWLDMARSKIRHQASVGPIAKVSKYWLRNVLVDKTNRTIAEGEMRAPLMRTAEPADRERRGRVSVCGVCAIRSDRGQGPRRCQAARVDGRPRIPQARPCSRRPAQRNKIGVFSDKQRRR